MAEFRVLGTRSVTIEQSGVVWIEAETEAEARQMAEDDPESLDWSWEEIDTDDGDSNTVEIKSVKAVIDEPDEEEPA